MIKKTLISIILTFNMLIVHCQSYNILYANIYNDTTWSADTIKVFDNIIIHENATLTINSGSFIEFQGHYSIEVHGIIKSLGLKNDSIRFSINDTTGFNDTTCVSGGWGGIRFKQRIQQDTSSFNYCSFSFGKAVVPDDLGFFNEGNNGGCISAIQYPNITITNSSFINNRANNRGAATYFLECEHIHIEECLFQSNFVYNSGGGIYLEKVDYFKIKNNLFYKNTAHQVVNYSGEAGSGSGVYISLGLGVVESNKFYNNKSIDGALYESCFNIRVINNIIANNYGVGLGEGTSYTNDALFANNTIVNNWGYIVPALWFNSTRTKMVNNIIWGNGSASFYGFQIYDLDGSLVADIIYSCIEDGYPGDGNIDQNPGFVNPTAGYGLDYDALNSDWSLLDNSPCINTGTPDTTWLNLPPLDLAGNPRIYGGRIDMGAYENQVVVGLQPKPMVSADIEIAPNPFNDRFSIHFLPDNKINRITIRNQAGVTVKKLEQLPISGLLTIDLQDCSPGLYVVIVEYANGTMKMKKLLKV